jgi:DNA polymerase III epsilon subunit-like protein
MNESYFICVDTETAGPNPASYSLLSIGAVAVAEPQRTFYVELQPTLMAESAEATSIHKLSLAQLAKSGLPPKEAIARFEAWVLETCAGRAPVFVAFNAAFDWMFVNDYFLSHLGRNPFGHAALDMKALFMGLQHVRWEETSYQAVSSHYGLPPALSHNALKDAQQGAEVFAAMLAEIKEKVYER